MTYLKVVLRISRYSKATNKYDKKCKESNRNVIIY